MSRGSVHLAGDSAHRLPPAGAKGLNLAVADADDLASGLIAGDTEGYSERRLAAAWLAAMFSDWLLTLINTPAAPFERSLNEARLAELRTSTALTDWFTRSYADTGLSRPGRCPA